MRALKDKVPSITWKKEDFQDAQGSGPRYEHRKHTMLSARVGLCKPYRQGLEEIPEDQQCSSCIVGVDGNDPGCERDEDVELVDKLLHLHERTRPAESYGALGVAVSLLLNFVLSPGHAQTITLHVRGTEIV